MKKTILICALTAVLSACGGGGSSSSAASESTVSTSFPLASAYKNLIASGKATNYAISGTCSGSGSISASAPSSSTFEGSSALSVTATSTYSFTNCTPASVAGSSISYYDSNYNFIGHTVAGQEYGKFISGTNALPTSVKVGDTAIYGTETIYSDSTKQTVIGTRALSFIIEQDGSSSSSVIANAITKNYNASNQLTFTQQTRYRLGVDGSFTPVSIDIQYSTTSSTHLILTAK
ncbi:MAG: hypothetical protein ACM3WS_03600 [Bacillota bacterium]